MKPVKAIINGKLVMADRIIPNGTILIRDSQILTCGARDEVEIPDACEIYDAGGAAM